MPDGTVRTYECDIDFVCLCCKQAVLQDPTGNRVLYHSSCPSVHVIYSPERSYLFSTEEDSVRERMSYIAESFWAKKLSDVPVVVTADFRDNYILPYMVGGG
mgnify:CR=1 FL=1